eukprot:TRINITY_DN2323_c0_g3_i1.p1 TRINITY_DN2323_c0_g3~~TRINITY_DN2323_c0_g3_i1.p1  ORF type:complete len:325 (-),score=91.99 TRINITY_DN2323_c0_g3_i1:110-1084(-)
MTRHIPQFAKIIDERYRNDSSKIAKLNYPSHIQSLVREIQESGINLRYLGYIRHYLKLPQLRNALLLEMLARTFKVTLRAALRKVATQVEVESTFKAIVGKYILLSHFSLPSIILSSLFPFPTSPVNTFNRFFIPTNSQEDQAWMASFFNELSIKYRHALSDSETIAVRASGLSGLASNMESINEWTYCLFHRMQALAAVEFFNSVVLECSTSQGMAVFSIKRDLVDDDRTSTEFMTEDIKEVMIATKRITMQPFTKDLMEQGKLQEAEEFFLRELTLKEQTVGENNIAVADTLDSLIDLYAKCGITMFQKASKYVKRAVLPIT